MADSFILKGKKSVYQNSGSALRLNPPRGGDTFKFPQWWDKKQVQQYVDSAIFVLTLSGDRKVKLVIPVTQNTEIKVVHDGEGNLKFPVHRGVDRVLICSEDNSEFYVEYQFPKISKGPILKRVIQAYPAPAVVEEG